MAIDFQKTFGRSNAQGNVPSSSTQDRPKAQFWLNVGYDSGVEDEETGTSRFVSLPVGIPLDTQESLPTNSRNRGYAEFQQARNDLLEQIMEVARNLKPGEEQFLNLQIQLRRVNDEQPELATTENRYAKKLALVS